MATSRLLGTIWNEMGDSMKVNTSRGPIARLYLALALAASLILGNASLAAAASPEPSLEAPSGPDTVQDGTCWLFGFITKANGSTTGSQGLQSCDGNVAEQAVTVFLDRCTVYIGWCWTWENYASFIPCTKWGPGDLWCPGVGSYLVHALQPGRYKTRVFGEVTSTLGAYETKWRDSVEVVLP